MVVIDFFATGKVIYKQLVILVAQSLHRLLLFARMSTDHRFTTVIVMIVMIMIISARATGCYITSACIIIIITIIEEQTFHGQIVRMTVSGRIETKFARIQFGLDVLEEPVFVEKLVIRIYRCCRCWLGCGTKTKMSADCCVIIIMSCRRSDSDW